MQKYVCVCVCACMRVQERADRGSQLCRGEDAPGKGRPGDSAQQESQQDGDQPPRVGVG